MLYFLSLLAGMMISVMVVFNGQLNAWANQAVSLVIIHAVGLAVLLPASLLGREKPRFVRLPWWLYTGGLIGVLTTVFNNAAFGQISVSSMMALALLGESVSGLLADHFGILGLPVRRFRAEKLWGMLMTLTGILLMLDDFKAVPTALSLMAGVTVLLSRLINGRLSRRTSVMTGTLTNYITGLLGALTVLALAGGGTKLTVALSGPLHVYLGGALGAVIVMMSNRIIGRIPSFYMTLTLFVGQVTAGQLLDTLLTGTVSARSLLGGALVLGGLLLNLVQDRAFSAREKQPEPGTDRSLFPSAFD